MEPTSKTAHDLEWPVLTRHLSDRCLSAQGRLRAALAALDGRAEDLFVSDGYQALRGVVALGDAIRAGG